MRDHLQANMEWLLSDDCLKRAQIKYELSQCELHLRQYWDSSAQDEFSLKEARVLCEQVIQYYSDYLQLIGQQLEPERLERLPDASVPDIHKCIARARQKLIKASSLSQQKACIHDLIAYYRQCQSRWMNAEAGIQSVAESPFPELQKLLKAEKPDVWLKYLIELGNRHSENICDLISLFFSQPLQSLQEWQNFFSDQEFVNFFNAVFYFKLNPAQLFDGKMPSEKLVSVRGRLGAIYQMVEYLQQQLINYCLQHQIPAINDLLFHGDELPQGIVFQVSDVVKQCLQQLVKECRPSRLGSDEQQRMHEKLHDMLRAYKFWFNPSRLIDAVMLLQQVLMNQSMETELNEPQFRQQMVLLYKHLKTTECLDLYGYFANKDSSYLLRLLRAVIEQQKPAWLPDLKEVEKKALVRVFQALQSVMEALREELAHRQISTEAYPIDFAKPLRKPGRRKRHAVLRVLSVYGLPLAKDNESLERLFNSVESSEAV